MSRKKLYLLDGMALAYRAHFAFINSRLKNSEGIPTGPVLGFANTLVKLLEEEKPTHISVVWDTSAPTFRHELDDDYKANRPPQPEDLQVGIPLIKKMVSHFGVKNLEQDGYEADDIIGTLAHRAKEVDVNVFLVTPDKDFMQLVQGHITMVKPDNQNGGFILIDREGVKEYFGVYPEQVVDVLACIGDTSDNIPGVPGIGKKGAPKLIRKYGSLEKAIEAAPEIKSKKYREGLTHYHEQAMHAKQMVKIKTDVPDVVNWEELSWGGPDKKQLGLFFRQMEFRTLTRKYLNEDPDKQPDLFTEGGIDPVGDDTGTGSTRRYNEEEVNYRVAVTEEEIRQVVRQLSDSTTICFDTETDSRDPVFAQPAGLSISPGPGIAWYMPMNVE
ncbi:MAG: 5'-3' exonuclease H3TH domain-containing protein, partial [Balneolaceae bacterium]